MFLNAGLITRVDVDLFHSDTLFAMFDVNLVTCKRFTRLFIFCCLNGSILLHLACILCSIVQVFEFVVVVRAIQPIRLSGINCYSSSVLILEFIQQALITAYFLSVHEYVVKVQSTILVKRVCIFRFPEADDKGVNVVFHAVSLSHH